jgi:hypothetical protein
MMAACRPSVQLAVRVPSTLAPLLPSGAGGGAPATVLPGGTGARVPGDAAWPAQAAACPAATRMLGSGELAAAAAALVAGKVAAAGLAAATADLD